MTDDTATKRMDEINQESACIALHLNSYQLRNLLRAIRTAPNDGDWYGELLGQIDHQLRLRSLCLSECYNPDKPWIREYTRRPNTPYPEGFTTRWGGAWNADSKCNQGREIK